ncbi:MAG: ATP-binding protein [Caulobacteraceae bacterium]
MSTGADPTEGGPIASAADNAGAIEAELAWFDQVLHARLALHFGQPCEYADVHEIVPPLLDGLSSGLGRLVRDHGLGWPERLVLTLALAPHVRPQILDPLFLRNSNIDRGFTEFGGWRGRSHSGFLPTGETAALLVAGEAIERRFELRRLFADDHPFRRRNILRLDHDAGGEPYLSGALMLSDETLTQLTRSGRHRPEFGAAFPAKLITSELSWEDLVLGREGRAELETITAWIRHGQTILEDWGFSRTIKPGYRSLFYGPPGTGKTLAAILIGKAVGSDVYRIDLSMVVSKYIGETEKNLARVFDQAQHSGWILFFDEADALFGKRTATSSAHDRYANQEVSYLLQRIEDFPGDVILATNLKGNLDEAFSRRFQSMVHFPMPSAEQRLRLWQGMLRPGERLAGDVRLPLLAEKYELSGGAIANVIRAGAILALQQGREAICAADLAHGVARELRKEGRTA